MPTEDTVDLNRVACAGVIDASPWDSNQQVQSQGDLGRSGVDPVDAQLIHQNMPMSLPSPVTGSMFVDIGPGATAHTSGLSAPGSQIGGFGQSHNGSMVSSTQSSFQPARGCPIRAGLRPPPIETDLMSGYITDSETDMDASDDHSMTPTIFQPLLPRTTYRLLYEFANSQQRPPSSSFASDGQNDRLCANSQSQALSVSSDYTRPGSKRKLQKSFGDNGDNGDNEEDQEEDRPSKRRPRSKSDLENKSRLLACPFQKLKPQKYKDCLNCFDMPRISRVK